MSKRLTFENCCFLLTRKGNVCSNYVEEVIVMWANQNPVFVYEKEPSRDILCIDCKSFYASVECVEMDLDPLTAMACKKLNDFPVIVIIRMNAAER